MNTPLKELMDEHHVNQTALADAIGVSRQSVKKWLDGNTITYPNLQKLSSYFGVTVPQLTGDEASGHLSRKRRGGRGSRS